MFGNGDIRIANQMVLIGSSRAADGYIVSLAVAQVSTGTETLYDTRTRWVTGLIEAGGTVVYDEYL